jgi:alkylhydroperoxidase family enzyme
MPQEARLPRIDREETDGGLRAAFDTFVEQRGKVPNLFRVAAHQPAIAETLAAHLQAVMGPGAVDPLLKELLSIRVSQINGCEY